MPLETATYLDDLNINNPVGSDPRSAGDDHLRLLKNVLKTTFPGLDSEFNTTVVTYQTKAEAEATPPPPSVAQMIRTGGYVNPGDGGGALYKRVGAEPAHLGKLRTSDLVWWELVIENGQVSIKQFGARGDNATDDSAAVQGALDFAAFNVTGTYYASGVEVIVPNSNTPYLMGSTTLKFKTAQVKLKGSGSGFPSAAPCALRWFANITGIQVNRYNTTGATTDAGTTAADGSVIEGLTLIGGGGTIAAVTDRTKGHGIDLRARAVIRNCVIKDFAGNGINIVASAGGAANLEGNANNWAIELCRVQSNGMSGLYVDGADVNAGYCIGIDVSSNGRWGIWDSSFLGNTYIAPHSATNGVANTALNGAGQSSFVHFNNGTDRRWAANVAATEAQLVATQPGTDPNVWIDISAGGSHSTIPTWTAAQPTGTYFHGGAYYTDNLNARNVFVGAYAESGQADAQLTRPTIVFGGTITLASTSTAPYLNTDTSGNLLNRKGFASIAVSGSTTITAILGGDAGNAEILEWLHSSETGSAPWRLRYVNGDWLFQNANSGSRIAAKLTGELTTEQMGTGSARPYLFNTATLALGAGTIMRQISYSNGAPVSGAHATGDIVFNPVYTPGGIIARWCSAAGTPGTWQDIRGVLSGSGSPEGVVSATVGAMYTRTDGGAGTTLYVKESGSGNTGWVAK